MSAPTAKEVEFGRRVANALVAWLAVEAYEKENGTVFDEPRGIDCPNCDKRGALRFARATRHVYLQCTTEGCLPYVSLNTWRRR